jgi:hypothetical protein
MKKLLCLVFVIVSIHASAQKILLSDQAEISVITCGPFQGELYSAFGHSAFRVYDPANNLNDAYNYGIFNFNQPNFYLNFTRGYLYYQLGVYDYTQFRDHYIYYNRYVHEQVLNLTPEQKQKMFEYLQWNALPENEHYRYDYFYNNCATKLRDVVVTNFGDSVKFDGSYITTTYTIRDLTDIYLDHQPWGDLGIDICLGLPMDKIATPYEYMFLPDYIESGFDHATILRNGSPIPLVKSKNIIYEARPQEIPGSPVHPWIVFIGLAVISIALSVFDMRRKKASIWFDAILFGVTGALGFLLLFLWVATDHAAAAKNMNLLWALPTNLIAAIAFVRSPKWLEKYFLIVSIVLALLLLTWAILPQELHRFLIPLVLAVLARAFAQYRLRNLQKI